MFVIQKKTKCDHYGAAITFSEVFGPTVCAKCESGKGYVYEEVPLIDALDEIGFKLVGPAYKNPIGWEPSKIDSYSK